MRYAKILFFFIVLSLFAVCSAAVNPFSPNPDHTTAADAPSWKNRVFLKIITWQQQLKEKITQQVREAKTTRSIKPLLVLVLAAFAYGVVHAAGPGHGKTLALAYVLSQRPSYINGLVFGNGIALFHGFSGIVFVLVIRWVLHGGILANLERVTQVTQVISYGLIACLGAGIFFQGMYRLIKRRHENPGFLPSDQNRKNFHPVVSALLVGATPCPGVAIVMLFALSMDLILLGVVLGIAISLGMALTVTLVVMLAVSGKSASMALAAKKQGRIEVLENLTRAGGGLALCALSALFLAAAI